MSNSYKTSNGERVKKSIIDLRVREAKKLALTLQLDEHGYNFCEDCGINANQGLPLDCSHEISVDECQKTGRSELAYDYNNIKIRCRKCHQIKDKLY